MALPNISFDPSHDLHVLRGQSVNIGTMVRVGSNNLNRYITDNSNAEFSYKLLTEGADSADGSFTGNTFNGLGFNFSSTTRILQIDPTIPAEEVYSFVFIVEGIDTDDPTPEMIQNNRKSAATRIHVHSGIAEAWLSPSPLTAYRGIQHSFKPSLYVRYSDGITYRIGVGFERLFSPVTPRINLRWNCPSRPEIISQTSGIIDPVATGTFDIQVTLTEASLGVDNTALGSVRITEDLSANSTITAELVTTGNCPGFSKIDEVPNFLFIPDGFLATDRAKFNHMVDEYVQALMTGNVTSPFNILSGSINFWKLFVPSREAGGTLLGEFFRFTSDSQLRGKPIPYIKPANFNTSEWIAHNILYHIGPPVPRHSTIGNTHNGNSPLTNDQIRNLWKATSSLNNAQVDAIPEQSINEWRRVATRSLPEELDTALGIFVNNYDSVTKRGDDDSIAFRFHRVRRFGLNTFFETLEDNHGNVIGPYFVSRPNSTGRTSDDGGDIRTFGKDFENLVVITALNQGRAANGRGFLFLEINDVANDTPVVLNGSKLFLAIQNTRTVLSTAQKATLTHEICHSLGLGDEYAEHPPQSSYRNRFIDDPVVSGWSQALYRSNPQVMDKYANLQTRHDLWIESPESSGNFRLHGAKLKWRLHRIEKCAVLTQAASQSGARITLTLRSGQADAFTADDPVYLRKRQSRALSIIIPSPDPDNPILAGLRDQDVEPIHGYRNSRPDDITDTTEYNLVPTRSDRMVVKAVNASGNTIEIETAPSTAGLHDYFFTLEPWEEIIVYKPMEVPGGESTAGYPFAELIAHPVLSFLNSSPFPFNAKADSAAGGALKEVIDTRGVQESRIPGSLVPSCSRRKKQIVAMYSGGHTFHGHIYHPTAQCMMRSHSHSSGSIEGLCEVCKYTLVNIVDPSKHPQLNEKYSKKIYPR